MPRELLPPRTPGTPALVVAATLLLVAGGPMVRAQEVPEPGAPAPRPPNVVVIVADDLGYGELGVQGSLDIPSPHIDSIAQGGVRFTNGYVSCPVCAPTRAGLLTGRYQQRFGFEHNPGPEASASADFGLPRDQPTIAERLKARGYATGLVGKWHLGFRPEVQPTARGFDEFFGFLGGAHAYLRANRRNAAPIVRGGERVDEKEYLTEAFAREAVAFIDRHRASHFFLALTFNAVHAPLQATDKYRSRLPAITDPKRQTFAAMLTALDDAVGRVLDKLRKEGLEDSTLVIFLSDNGGPTAQTTSRNGPLRGVKGQVFEGGIRVPFMMRWPGRVPAGRVFEAPVIALDIAPTVFAAAQVELPADTKLDGVDLLPYLAGAKEGAPHESLFWRFGNQAAIRQGAWKLVMPQQGAPALFNLAQDLGERTDLIGREPEKAKELKAAFDAWNAGLAAPKWRRGGANSPEGGTGGGEGGVAPSGERGKRL